MIRLSKEDGIARIRLDRPERLNAISPQMLRDLVDVCEDIASDSTIRVVTLVGEGGSFSAGADLPTFAADLAASPQETADLGRVAVDVLARLPQITVAVIRGHCVGGGIVLAAACDLRICAEDSRFAIPELDVGIPLAWGGMGHLVRLVGETLAADLVLSCRPFDAEEALRAGFVSRVVVDQDLESEAARLVDSIAGRPSTLLRLTKRQLRAIGAGTFDPATDAEALLECLDDPETAALLTATIDRLR
jgi:enoyl-CoA hydratase/carnithine racemase